MAKYYGVEQNGEFIFVDAGGKRVPEEELNKGFVLVTHEAELASSKVKTITQSGKYGYQTSDGQSLVDCVLSYDIKTAQGFVDAMSSLKTKYIKLIQQHPENKAQLRQALEQDIRSLHEARVKIVAYQRKLEKEATANPVNTDTNGASPTKNQSTQPTKTLLGNGITMLRDAQGHFGYEDNNGNVFIPCNLPIDVSVSSREYNASVTALLNEYKTQINSCPPSERQAVKESSKQIVTLIQSARQAYISKVQELDATNSTSTAPAEPTKANKEETKAETIKDNSGELKKVEKDGKYGLVNEKGEEVIKCVYDKIDILDGYFARVSIDGEWGLINNEGKEIVERAYDYIGLEGDYISIKKHGKWGFINKKGEEIVKCIYDDLGNLNQDYIRAKKGDKYGFINNKGEVILKFNYDYVDDFDGDLASAKKDGKWGIINKKGEKIVECAYDYIESYLSKHLFAIKKDGKWGFFNKERENAVKCIYDSISSLNYDFVLAKKDGKWGVVDKNGEEILKCNFTEEEVKDIFAKIENGTFNPENYKQGIKKADDNKNKNIAGNKKDATADGEGVTGDDGGITA